MAKLWTDGKMLRVDDQPRDGEQEVDPAWSSSLAKVMRYIGEVYAVPHPQLVTLRQTCIAAGGSGVNPAHVAIAVITMLQNGNDIDRVLAIDAAHWHKLAKSFDLQY